MKIYKKNERIFIFSIAVFLNSLILSSAIFAQEVTTSVDRLENQVTTAEYENGWKVTETLKPSDEEVSSCEISSSFDAPIALEVYQYKNNLTVVLWDVAFKDYYKDSEWFNVAVESQSFNFEKRFMYRGTSDAVTWWDTPNREAEFFVSILRKNGRISFYYDGVGVRNLMLVGNEDAMSLFDECVKKIKK